MSFEASRLRRGEVIVALASLILLVSLLAAPWYGAAPAIRPGGSRAGPAFPVDGWQSLTAVRWLILATAAAGLALGWAQATRRAPALPATLAEIATVLGGLASLALVWRVLISVPYAGSHVGPRAGAYAGLACALAIAAGGLVSLREEDRPDPERNARIPTVRLDELPADRGRRGARS